MPTYFLDSSAMVKFYVAEAGTHFVQGLFDPAGINDLVICWISRVEVVAAVTRRSRGGSLATADAPRIIREFRLDFTTEFRLVDVSPTLLDHAADLAERYALRSYDAVQLAAAVGAHTAARGSGTTLILVSSDVELNAAAVAEGLTVEDPNRYP